MYRTLGLQGAGLKNMHCCLHWCLSVSLLKGVDSLQESGFLHLHLQLSFLHLKHFHFQMQCLLEQLWHFNLVSPSFFIITGVSSLFLNDCFFRQFFLGQASTMSFALLFWFFVSRKAGRFAKQVHSPKVTSVFFTTWGAEPVLGNWFFHSICTLFAVS